MSKKPVQFWFDMKEGDESFYEREGAVFRQRAGHDLELFGQSDGKFYPYTGDQHRVPYEATAVTLEEVRPYMDVPPVDYPEEKAP